MNIAPQDYGKARARIDEQIARLDEILAVNGQLGLSAGHISAQGQPSFGSCLNDPQELLTPADDVVGDLHGDAGQEQILVELDDAQQ